MEGLSLIALGVGDAFSALYYSSCLAVSYGDSRLLIDCPHPIRKILRESGDAAGIELDVGSFDAVVLTHLHADHCSGLEGFGYFSYFVTKRKARILTHPLVADRLWAGHLAAGMEQLMPGRDAAPEPKHLDDYFEVEHLSEESAVSIGPFEIECRRTIHHVPTTALRIRAGGRCLGYSADTAFDEGLIEWLGEADLIVHETNLGVHTPYEDLAALPAELRARMRLIHYTDMFDREASSIECLRQGQLTRV